MNVDETQAPQRARFRCPKCRGTILEVEVTTRMQLLQNAFDDIETIEPSAQSIHDWDSRSPMECMECHHTADAREFDSDTHLSIEDGDRLRFLTEAKRIDDTLTAAEKEELAELEARAKDWGTP